MRKRILMLPGSLLAAALAISAAYHVSEASNHDDVPNGEKISNSLNLTDHFAFKSPADPTQLSLIMYFNPRSLPGKAYFMNTKARYEFHVTKIASKTAPVAPKDDFVFRFEATAPDVTGAQSITLTVLKDGMVVGTNKGMSTTVGNSRAGNIVTNMGTGVGGIDVKWFVGQRADSFHFDVIRFFQVRQFLAERFFGGPGGIGNATAGLADNCRGDKFLAVALPGGAAANEAGGVPDGDVINLFNPPSCAPDFVKNLNVTAIVLNVPIAQLGGGTIFDTWSTISVAQ